MQYYYLLILLHWVPWKFKWLKLNLSKPGNFAPLKVVAIVRSCLIFFVPGTYQNNIQFGRKVAEVICCVLKENILRALEITI